MIGSLSPAKRQFFQENHGGQIPEGLLRTVVLAAPTVEGRTGACRDLGSIEQTRHDVGGFFAISAVSTHVIGHRECMLVTRHHYAAVAPTRTQEELSLVRDHWVERSSRGSMAGSSDEIARDECGSMSSVKQALWVLSQLLRTLRNWL